MSDDIRETTALVPAARPAPKTRTGGILLGVLLLLSPVLVAGAFLSGFLESRDTEFFHANPVAEYRSLGDGVRRVFSRSFAERSEPRGWYAPLSQLTAGLQYRYLHEYPWTFRLANLLLHLGTALFLYRVILGLLPRGAPLSAAEEPINADASFNTTHRAVAVFGALFFFLHPVNVEALTWVSQRGVVQAGFFAVLAWWLVVRQGADRANWRRLAPPGWGSYGLSMLCFVLAALSHPMACGFAGVLLLTELLWVCDPSPSRWLRVAGYAGGGAVFALLLAQAGLWTPAAGAARSLEQAALDALPVLGRGALNILAPVQLSAIYTVVSPEGFWLWVPVGLLLALVIIPAWLPLGSRPASVLLLGGGVVMLPWLIPGSGTCGLHDHAFYLAMPVAGVLFGLSAEALQYRLRFCGKEGGKIGEVVSFGLAVLVFLLLALLSLARSFDLSSQEAMLRNAVARQPLSYLANLTLAEELGGQARNATAQTPEKAQTLWSEAYRYVEVLKHATDRERCADAVRQGLLEGEIALRLGDEGSEGRIREWRKRAGDRSKLLVRADELLTEVLLNRYRQTQERGLLEECLGLQDEILRLQPAGPEAERVRLQRAEMLESLGRAAEAKKEYESLLCHPQWGERAKAGLLRLGETALP